MIPIMNQNRRKVKIFFVFYAGTGFLMRSEIPGLFGELK
jgi:hypothetical protein